MGGGGAYTCRGLFLEFCCISMFRTVGSFLLRGESRTQGNTEGTPAFKSFLPANVFTMSPTLKRKREYLLCWVGHLDVLSLISSYRVEPSLLHLKVIDGKFKERPFCPIRISVAFLWTSRNTTVC